MNIILWVLQAILGSMFLMAGFMKLFKPKDQLKEKLGDWVDALSDTSFKLIGLVEILAAIGLILPMGLLILPILTPLAAVGLMLTMIGAIILHIKRKEYDKLKVNILILVVALFISLGRFFLIPVS